jgi:hypothetical protein
MAKQTKPFDPRRPNGEDVKVGANAASTITSSDMQKAYVYEDRRARRRINEIGRINRQTLRELGAQIVAR